MKRLTLSVLLLGTSILTTGYLRGQNQSGPATPAAAPQKLVRVATLKTVEANREFQANVQLLQAQRQAAVELNANMEKEKDAAKKKELKTQFDQLMARLNENNDKMQKSYGFSLARNYTMEIETAHIYMIVTEEEAAKIDQAQKAAEKGKK